MTTFASIEAFYADRPERDSVQQDFGVRWWQGGATWPQHRVSWVEVTGEFYAVNLGGVHHPDGGRVELLGVVEGRDAAEAALAGWAELDGYAAQLEWVRERLP